MCAFVEVDECKVSTLNWGQSKLLPHLFDDCFMQTHKAISLVEDKIYR